MTYTVEQLETKARKIRLHIVKMIGYGKPGHFGGSCSIADLVTVLYFHKMKHDPNNPKWEERDRFLLSKGHSVPAQYAALVEAGYFPATELGRFKDLGSILQGHPDMTKGPGIEANTGSLGQGLSIAAGMAAGGKLDRRSYKVYCVIGDGEMAEGQIWEAAMAAAVYKLDNLVAILDKNGLQATGSVAERFNTEPVVDKWRAFGWHVIECNGHDLTEIMAAFDKADEIKDKPVLIVANTIKGKGISFAENIAAFHHGVMTEAQYRQALKELGEEGGDRA
jgi:transketolase